MNALFSLRSSINIFLSIYLYSNVFPFKGRYKRKNFILAVYSIASSVIAFFIIPYTNITLFVAYHAFTGLIYCIVFLGYGIMYKINYVLLFHSSLSMIYLILPTINNLLPESFIGTFAYQIIFYFLGVLFVVIIVKLLIFYKYKNSYNIPQKYRMVLFIESSACVFVVMSRPMLEAISVSSAFGSVLIGYIYIIILLLHIIYIQLLSEYDEKYRSILSNTQLAQQKQRADEMIQSYEHLVLLKHEYANQIHYMSTMLDNKKYDELREHFNELYKTKYHQDIISYGNDVLSSLIHQKFIYAKSHNITFSTKIVLTRELKIRSADLFSLLSNVLDNAIEASEKVCNPVITVEIKIEKSYLIIICKNKVDADVLLENPELSTMKKDKALHGIGLQVVRNIVKHYDGMLGFRMDGDFFVVDIMLKMDIEITEK